MGLMDEAAREQAVDADASREDARGGGDTTLGGGGETNLGGVGDAGARGQTDEEEDVVAADASETGSSSRIRYT